MAETKWIFNELDFLDKVLDDINTSIQSSCFGVYLRNDNNDEVLLKDRRARSAGRRAFFPMYRGAFSP